MDHGRRLMTVLMTAMVMGFQWQESGGAQDKPERWVPPLVQNVRVPAGVQGGVYILEHEEPVMVRPGVWEEAPPASTPASVPADTDIRVSLRGTLKLSAALDLITGAAHRELTLGPGVLDSDVTLDGVDMPFERALTRVLSPSGYGYRLQANEVVVLARDTRRFRLNLPPVTQAFDAQTTNESSSAASGTSAAELSGAANQRERTRIGARVQVRNSAPSLSYWEDIEANVKALLSPEGTATFNRAAGLAVVTDMPRVLDSLAEFFAGINAAAAEQIMVDVKIVEVQLARSHRLGIDWTALGSSGDLKGLGLMTNVASQNMPAGSMMTLAARAPEDASGDTQAGVKAVLRALETFGRVDVVSQPRIMMLNNSVASIQVGETRSYVESTNVETTAAGGTIASASLGEVHGGVTLELVGSIVGEEVFLSVTPVVSAIDDIRTIALGGGGKLEAPETSLKTMTTMVRVRCGATAMVGGLITRIRAKTREGVPFLGRLPVIGKLFSYEVRRNDRTELVIFMTPRRG